MDITKRETLYTTVELFRESKHVALYFNSKEIRFHEFLKRVNVTADKLFSHGIRKDSVVALLSPNVPEAIITLYALSKIGAIVSLLHPLLPPEVLNESIKETKTTHFIVLDVLAYKYQEVLKKNDVDTLLISAYPDLSLAMKLGFKIKYKKELSLIDKTKYIKDIDSSLKAELNLDGEKAAFYLRSGGTTGKSKIVVLSEKSIIFVTSKSKEILCHDTTGKSMIGLLPIFHGFGLAMGIHAPLSNEAATDLMISFNAKKVINDIKKNHLNVLLTIPYMTDRLLLNKKFSGKKLKNLIATFIGADKPEERLFEAFDNRMKEAGSDCRLLQGYGLTETVTVNYVNTLKNNKIGSVGKGLFGVKTKIINHEVSYEEPLKAGEIGEILISSPSLCLGYLNSDVQPFYIDENGEKWLKTGDIGYLDEEGYLFFINRAKDVYKISGYNVFPSDIEKYADEVRGVKSAAVTYVDDEKHPYFILYVESDREDKEQLEREIKEHLNQYLFKYSIPEKIIITKKLPRTEIGKIDRKKLNTLN